MEIVRGQNKKFNSVRRLFAVEKLAGIFITKLFISRNRRESFIIEIKQFYLKQGEKNYGEKR